MRDEKSYGYGELVGILMLLIALALLVVLAKPAVEEFFARATAAVDHEFTYTAHRRLQ